MIDIEWDIDISGSNEWNLFSIQHTRIPIDTYHRYNIKTKNGYIQFFVNFMIDISWDIDISGLREWNRF